MTNPHNLKVGQKLWRVAARQGSNEFAEITKIGRKWATIGEGWGAEKVCLKDLYVDGGKYSSPAQCYLSKEAWERGGIVRAKWGEIRRHVGQYTPPPKVNLDAMNKICEALGIEGLPNQ